MTDTQKSEIRSEIAGAVAVAAASAATYVIAQYATKKLITWAVTKTAK